MTGREARRPWVLALAGGLVVAGALMYMAPVAAAAGTLAPRTASVAGTQGIDTSLPATPSAVTVHGRGQFSSLAITVNQTRNLNNQTVSITWTGGTPTVQGPGRFGSQFLQIFQCWGDDDGTNADNPGPPASQCEQGAVAGTYSGVPDGVYSNGFTLSRVISRTGWPNYRRADGVQDPSNSNLWMPFTAVDGTAIGAQFDANFNPSVSGGNYWLNPYFNSVTTNEIASAATMADGTGAELFQVLTGVESSGLGCGQKVQPVPGGGTKVPKCWLVVVPRGSAADENVGTPFTSNADQYGVFTSPLAPAVWQRRISIPLEFNPVDSPCPLGAEELRISGSELAIPAVSSWQVPLCGRSDLQPFSYAPVSDSTARQQLNSSADGGPGMVVLSNPLDPNVVDPNNPVVYAPVTASGLAIAFNIERYPSLSASPAENALSGIRVADLRLTPRLIAKLLTQSYSSAVKIGGGNPGYSWLASNPSHLGVDPDFLRFNPEFSELQSGNPRAFSGLSFPAGNSDAIEALWRYVFADPEARHWLEGNPDQWGMKVNPVYDASSANPGGAPFGTPMPNSFPKSEPFCFQSPPVGLSVKITPTVLCGTDWMPYTRSLTDSAKVVRTAYDGARVSLNVYAVTPAEAWQRVQPQYLGTRSVLAVTDTPSAAQFGTQTARLSRAGDDSDGRAFIAADDASLTAAIGDMVPSAEPSVLMLDPTRVGAGAYPLTQLTYAAIKPRVLTADQRRQFADFVAFAGGDGQVSGLDPGQLPRGYVPLTSSLRAAAASAAERVRTMTSLDTSITTTTVSGGPTTTWYSAGGTDTTTSTPVDGSTATTSTVAATSSSSTTLADAGVVTGNSSAVTPDVSAGASGLAIPGVGLIAVGSAVGALEISHRPRRRRRKAAK